MRCLNSSWEAVGSGSPVISRKQEQALEKQMRLNQLKRGEKR